ncbi:MAG: sulfatase [Bryobacterales bacterium]|nr:sulfatase [Acidobacteriota bacterium]MCB9385991.1 sulfatase [Bryobacterales bacterium]
MLVLAACGSKPQAARPPNFIILWCDNLGYGDVEPFGSTLHRTPNLNRMASEGRRFTDFYSTSGVCTPSRSSLMTGAYPQRIGMAYNERDQHVLRPLSPYGLNPDEITVAEALKQQGYATGILGKWHLGDQLELLPTRQGFDYYWGVPYSDDMTQEAGQRIAQRPGNNVDAERWPPLPLMENETVVEAPADRNTLTKREAEHAVAFIQQHRDEPFFLFVSHAMPGSTATPFSSEAFRGKSANGPWGDAVEELDWAAGQILDKLVELGLAENTLVIWTSDNGAPINREPGNLARGSNLPLYGPGYSTAEGGQRIPMIAWMPGTVPAGTTESELASTLDVLPTFVRMAGGQPPADRKLDGYDIHALLTGRPGALSPYRAFLYFDREQLQAVRSGEWKLFLPLESFERHPHFKPGEGGKPLLFNLADDISSSHDVAAEHPDVVARLTELAERSRDEIAQNKRPRGHVEHPEPRLLP